MKRIVGPYLARMSRDESAATSVEYALISSLVVLVIVGAVGLVGGNLTALFQQVAAAFP